MEHNQLAERCTQLAIACSNPSIAGTLMRLASDYGTRRFDQPSAWEQPSQLPSDPFGFGD